jgi:transcriptional regulator with XRE-family HTH domain
MNDDETTVPGMADAIERRRIELGMTPGEFADAAGLTRQGLNPVRQGRRKAYQDKVKIGVARALRWRGDAIDRLLAGDTPLELDERAPDMGADAVLAEIMTLRDRVEQLTAEVARLRDAPRSTDRPPSAPPRRRET